MKKLCIAVFLGFFMFILASGTASANLISNGGFQLGTQPTVNDFSASSGPYGAWLGLHGGTSSTPTDWWVVAQQDDGKVAGDYYAKHFMNTSKLYQGFLAVPDGTQLSLSFEYKFLATSSKAFVTLIMKDLVKVKPPLSVTRMQTT